MVYNYRSIVNHILKKTEFSSTGETNDLLFSGSNIDPIVDRVKDWTNEVYLEICNAGYWRFLETENSFQTIVGQESYNLNNDCQNGRIIDIRETYTPKLLLRSDFKDIAKLNADTLTSNLDIPQYYYFINNELYLYPLPSEVITVKYRYYKTISELENPTDVPIIPQEWKWVWINGVLVRLNGYLQDQSLSNAEIIYMNGIQQMRAANRADRKNKPSFRLE